VATDLPVAGRTEDYTTKPTIVEQTSVSYLPGPKAVLKDEDKYATLVAAYICADLVPEWEKLFVEKNSGYGEGHRDLGIKAQYVDIHRKVSKLRRAFWDGEELTGEQPREVLLDLIGHCFLAISLLDEDGKGDGRSA
jgi:hypothetical protein